MLSTPLITFALLAAIGCLGFYYVCFRRTRAERSRLNTLLEERTAQLAYALEGERKALVSEIRAREAADEARRTRNIFLASISHEIRTPMNGVIGMASLLEQTDLTSEQRGYTGIIHSCGETLLNVINNVIDLSTIESGTVEVDQKEFDLAACIEEVLAVFRVRCIQTGIRLHYHIDREVPKKIITDGNRLRQILINVIDNAARFTRKGEIGIRIFISQPSTPASPPFPPTGQMEIGFEIKDTGIGTPGDPFDSLGLAISDKLIRLLNGRIRVNAEQGKGTLVTFTILAMKPPTVEPLSV